MLGKPCTCTGSADFSGIKGVYSELSGVDLLNFHCGDGIEEVDGFLEIVISNSMGLDMVLIVCSPFQKGFDSLEWNIELDKLENFLT